MIYSLNKVQVNLASVIRNNKTIDEKIEELNLIIVIMKEIENDTNIELDYEYNKSDYAEVYSLISSYEKEKNND